MTGALVTALLAGVVVALWPDRSARSRLFPRRPGLPVLRRTVVAMTAGPSWRAAVALSGLAAVVGALVGGPVAAVVAGAYAGLAGRERLRRAGRRRVAAGRVVALDGLGSMVADLRAGVPPTVVAGTFVAAPVVAASAVTALVTGASAAGASAAGTSVAGASVAGDERISALVAAVWRLAERSGAPAADLLDRIESDARTADRAAATAAAQAAGAQATAVLLAALPLGGIGLGYAIGADPLEVLLRTPIGAACAIAAVALQCAGLQWSQHLTDGASR